MTGTDADTGQLWQAVTYLLQGKLITRARETNVFFKAPARTVQCCQGREALHVGGGHDVLQEVVAVGEGGVHSHLVLPLKFSPHVPEQEGRQGPMSLLVN